MPKLCLRYEPKIIDIQFDILVRKIYQKCCKNSTYSLINFKPHRYRGHPNSDSGSDGEIDSAQKQDIIDIETVKPPDIKGTLKFFLNLIWI